MYSLLVAQVMNLKAASFCFEALSMARAHDQSHPEYEVFTVGAKA